LKIANLHQKLLLSLIRDIREHKAAEGVSNEVLSADLKKVISGLHQWQRGGFNIANALEKLAPRRYPFSAALVAGLDNYHFYKRRLAVAFMRDSLIPSEIFGSITIGSRAITIVDAFFGVENIEINDVPSYFNVRNCRPFNPNGPINYHPANYRPSIPTFKINREEGNEKA
jgi:hypothetical protein